MKALVTASLLASLSLVPQLARAQEPPDVARLFSHEADVSTPGQGPYRVGLGPEVLAQCQPDLSDVRLYDASGREIPWLLDSAGRLPRGAAEVIASHSAPALEATRGREGTPLTSFRETYTLAAPEAAPARAEWNLVVDVRREAFVAAIRVVELVPGGAERELVSTSLYRMQAPTRERLRFAVPGTTSANLRVELTGQDGFVEPLFRWEATRLVRGATTLTIPLEIAERRAEPGRTILVVTRPEGTIPDRLRFATSTSAFARVLRIDDLTSTSGEIHRVPSVRDAESLDVAVPPLRGATFTITIDDGDSRALEGLTVSAVVSQPSLVVFEPASLLRFGGGRVRAPRYDLELLSGSWMIDRLIDGSTTPTDAIVGPARPSPGWDPAPALAFLHRPGVVVSPTEYRFVAPLSVETAPEGASRFLLSPAALSALDEDRADLRIVDAQARQWPFLMTARPSMTIPLAISPAARDGDETRYALRLPVERANLTELRLVADAELISRRARVVGIDARGDEVTLGSGVLEHAPGQAEPMSVSLSGLRVSELALLVEDGDESPLAFSSIEARLETSEIFLIAPPGSYRMLLGNEAANAPAYDIERARGLLIAIPPAAAMLGPLARNPEFHEPGLIEAAGTQTVALWLVLVLAVLVLGALTLRASRDPAEETPSPARGDAPSTRAPDGEPPPSDDSEE